jgi:predicted MFS family arabinose efflux permease
VFLGGLIVPSAAIALGWRPTLVLVALIPVVAVPLALAVLPADRPAAVATTGSPDEPLPEAIRFLAAYGFLLGFAGGVTFLVPLYAEEALGLSPRVGGAAVGVMGFTAIFGRIGWARVAERARRYEASLAWIAALSVLATAALFAAEGGGVALLWIGVVLTGLSSSTWNSVGMLAVMLEAGPARSGRASGVVMFGFLTGLGVAPPLFGWTVDLTGSYATMWVASIAAAVAATVLTIGWQARTR